MKNAVPVLVLGCLLVSAVAEAKPFTSKTGRFSFDFPSAPKEETDPIAAGGKTLTMHSFNAELPDGLVTVAYIDYPDGGGMTPAVRIDKIVDGEVQAQSGTVVSPKTRCDKGAIACRALSYTGATDSGVKMMKVLRSYLVGNRVYSAYVVTVAEGGTAPAKIGALLDSMRITSP